MYYYNKKEGPMESNQLPKHFLKPTWNSISKLKKQKGPSQTKQCLCFQKYPFNLETHPCRPLKFIPSCGRKRWALVKLN